MSEIERLQRLAGIMPKTLSLQEDGDFERVIDKMLDYLDADSVMKEGSGNFSEDYTDIKFDARATADYAEQISQAIQKITGAPVSITPERGDPRDEGKYNLVVNPSTDNREVGYIVKDGNDGATVENISKAIDPFYRMFREKGWVFTQPFRGAFTIGVPAPDELAEIKRLAGIMPKTLSLQEDGEPDTGDTVTKTVVGHVDDEPDMVRQELYKMGKYCIDLYRMLGEVPNGDLPEWWTAKITKASDYIGTAKHYLEAELYAPKDVAVVVTPDAERAD